MKTVAIAGLALALLSGAWGAYTAVASVKASVAAHAQRAA